jgi:uncharacterized protein YdeI (YjbR/CyaY-like superfamily)
MGTRDPRIDRYIERSADFARPILTRVRDVVHAACPEVEESVKWGAPFFLYNGMLCRMASFKQHCALTFWKESLIADEGGNGGREALDQLQRITALSDLPAKTVLTRYIKSAMALNDAGVRPAARARPKAKRVLVVPDDLAAALRRNRAAAAAFETFSPSRRREYVEWLTEAKRPETRARRLETAVGWIAEGKPRHWKYIKS